MIYKYGIDFGTTNSSIAKTIDDYGSKVTEVYKLRLEREELGNVLPSIACINEYGEIYACDEALNYSFETDGLYKQLIKKVKMHLKEHPNGEEELFGVQSGVKKETSDIIAEILRKLRIKAEKIDEENGEKIDFSGVIMGVPVGFTDNQKRLLEKSLLKAGFYETEEMAQKKTEFISEPVAVAINYGLKFDRDQNVLIFDFGGGTLDIAVVALKEQTEHEKYPHRILSKVGADIGGEYLNELFFENCIAKKYGVKYLAEKLGEHKCLQYDTKKEKCKALWDALISGENQSGIDLINEVDELKRELSYEERKEIEPYLKHDDILLDTRVFRRSEFEDAIEDAIQIIKDKIEQCIDEANVNVSDIDQVLLAGGSSLIPCIIKILKDKFGKEKMRRYNIPSSEEIMLGVVRGLSIAGCKEHDDDIYVDDIVDCDYGILAVDKETGEDKVSVIIKKGTRVAETQINEQDISQGIYRKYTSEDMAADDIVIETYENDEVIGRFNIRKPRTDKFRIYMSVDPKKGWLTVHMYDTKHESWIKDIPLEKRSFVTKK